MSESQLSPGTVVDGAYTLDTVVRSRAGATTYQATDGQAASVWVTVYDGSCFASGLALERSLRELRQLKNVTSPRVLRVLAAGKHGDGIFEVTEVGPSETLAEHLQQGALSMQDAATLAVQVGEALLEAQRAGVIHRNLGADIVFPSPEGVRVGGFAVGEPQTRGAGPLMTIAPEQVAGKVVDQRTLIYNVAALMQWMISGSPLFPGVGDEVLAAHESQAPDASIDAKLRRALGKDPRMRPMMLKQFLADIAQMGGVEPPKLSARVSAPNLGGVPKAPIAAPKAPDAAVSRPSSRGWTMFMQAQDDEPSKPAEPAPPPSKPSTRGWTMFMQAQDDEPATPSEAAATPEPAAAPEPAAEPAPEAAPAEGSPSTRGWTMFMKSEGGDAQPAGDPEGQEPAEPAATAPAAAEPAAAEPADAGSPSTRGWTMFTKDEDPEPAAAEEPAPEPEPAAAEEPAAPTTRGWTMFTKDEDAAPDAAAPEPAAPEPAAAEAPAPAAPTADAAPSSRGWTMFMEPGAGQAPSAEAPAAEAPAPEQPAAEAPAAEGSADGAPKKRGWTMFMNAPLEDLPKKPEEAAQAEPTPPVSNIEAADQKGWTVFGAPALKRPEEGEGPAAAASTGTVVPPSEPEPAAPARGKTVMVTHPGPTPDPAAPAASAPDAALAGAQTVVNTQAGTPIEKGKTIVATASPVDAKPDTMYFKKGEVEPEGGVSARAPTVRDVPSSARPVEERVARPEPSGPVPAVPEPAALEPTKSSNTALYAIAGAVAVVAAIAAFFAFS
jgi:hypothetical protein